jgi:hypothetical protein
VCIKKIFAVARISLISTCDNLLTVFDARYLNFQKEEKERSFEGNLRD